MTCSTIFGIDSHARTTTICALETETGVTTVRTFRGNGYGSMAEWMARFPAPACGVYEAGCTGFVPARMLTTGDVRVVPIAPSKMPKPSESRTRKNDRNDAMRLARLALAGEPHKVWVPGEEVEGMRDLAHALDDLRGQRQRAYQRVLALLCRHGIVRDQRTRTGRLKKARGGEFWAWPGKVEVGDPISQAAPLAAVRAARVGPRAVRRAAAQGARACRRDVSLRGDRRAAVPQVRELRDRALVLRRRGRLLQVPLW